MSTVPENPSEPFVLTEKMEGQRGEAFCWEHSPADVAELAACGNPFSARRWMVYLPDHDDRSIDDDENPSTGVFVISWRDNTHERYAHLRGRHPAFASRYALEIKEAYQPDASHHYPRTCNDVGEPLLAEYQEDLSAADHLMRLWAQELVEGRLTPYGPPETPEQAQTRVTAYYADLVSRAGALARQGA